MRIHFAYGAGQLSSPSCCVTSSRDKEHGEKVLQRCDCGVKMHSTRYRNESAIKADALTLLWPMTKP